MGGFRLYRQAMRYLYLLGVCLLFNCSGDGNSKRDAGKDTATGDIGKDTARDTKPEDADGDAGANDAANDSGDAGIEAFDYVSEVCKRYVACGATYLFGPAFSDQAQCEAMSRPLIDSFSQDTDEVDVDEAQQKLCAAAIKNTSCADIENGLFEDKTTACDPDSLFSGKLGLGACCTDPYSCMDGLFCDGLDLGQSGTCQNRSGEGDDCVDSDSCQKPLYCDFFTDTCATESKESESCDERQCEAGLYCDEKTLVCNKLKANGMMCDTGVECQNHFCDDNSICADRLAAGMDCTHAGQCKTNLFCHGDTNNKTCKPWLDAAASCDGDGCKWGLSCQSSTCTTAPDTGQACSPIDNLCRSFHADYCDDTTLICTKRKKIGATCESGECEFGLICNGDKCVGAPVCL